MNLWFITAIETDFSNEAPMSLSSLTSPENSPATSRRGLPAWLIPLILLLGFAVVFAFLFGEKFLPSLAVKTAPVVTLRGTAAHSGESTQELLFQASGWLEPEPYAIQVPSLVNGIVNEVHVLEGDTVKKGDLLATLVDDEARLNLERSERMLTTIRSQVVAHCSRVPESKARLSAARAKVLAEDARLAEITDTANRLKSLPEGAASLGEITTAILQVERQAAVLAEARSEIPRIEAELATIDYERIAMGNTFLEAEAERDLAQLALSRHRITSPIDGRVLLLHAQPGKKKMLNMDDPKSALIVELYQPAHLQARIDVPLNEAAALQIGQPVELTTELLPDLVLIGTVLRITGEADIARNTLQAKVTIAGPDDRLRPEMLVRAKFFSAPSEPKEGKNDESSSERLLLFAPTNALFDLQDNSAKAWVVTPESTAELRSLTLGSTRKEGAREVRSGLRSGEKLILPPLSELTPGHRITATPSNP